MLLPRFWPKELSILREVSLLCQPREIQKMKKHNLPPLHGAFTLTWLCGAAGFHTSWNKGCFTFLIWEIWVLTILAWEDCFPLRNVSKAPVPHGCPWRVHSYYCPQHFTNRNPRLQESLWWITVYSELNHFPPGWRGRSLRLRVNCPTGPANKETQWGSGNSWNGQDSQNPSSNSSILGEETPADWAARRSY